MKKHRLVSAGIVLIIILSWLQPVWADRGRGRDKNWRKQARPEHSRRLQEKYRDNKNYVFDKRYNHNRYYPKRGHVVKKLPRHHRVIKHRRERYFFDDGIWYRPAVNGFVVARPPIGLVVPVLPSFHTTIWVGSTPYYYADGVYYIWSAGERVYMVTDPPLEEEVIPHDKIPDQLFIYPKQGQSKEQQATDRYECHRWAVEQTGFDPSKPGGDVPADKHADKRIEYQRAMKACLEARNYSVQ
jgi:hypothetical protein